MIHDPHRRTNLSEPDEHLRPHPAASELTDDDLRKTPEERRENHAARVTSGGVATASRAERRVGSRLLTYGLLVLGLAIIIAAIIFGTWNWTLFLLGLAIIFCYMALITAPFWLASSTKVAQDEAAKDRVPERRPTGEDRRRFTESGAATRPNATSRRERSDYR